MKRTLTVFATAMIGLGGSFFASQVTIDNTDMVSAERRITVDQGMKAMMYEAVNEEQLQDFWIQGDGVHPQKFYLKKSQLANDLVERLINEKQAKIKVVSDFSTLDNGQELTLQGVPAFFVETLNEIWVLETASNDSLVTVVTDLLN